jgi:hypothetical protein
MFVVLNTLLLHHRETTKNSSRFAKVTLCCGAPGDRPVLKQQAMPVPAVIVPVYTRAPKPALTSGSQPSGAGLGAFGGVEGTTVACGSFILSNEELGKDLAAQLATPNKLIDFVFLTQ